MRPSDTSCPRTLHQPTIPLHGLPITYAHYRSHTVNSNTVNSKFHLIQSFYEVFVNIFSIISCLKFTVNLNFHLIQSKTLPTNDLELTVPDLYQDVLLEVNKHWKKLVFMHNYK